MVSAGIFKDVLMILTTKRKGSKPVYEYYKKGMRMAGRPAWSDVKDEIKELIEDRNFEEFVDVVHVSGRFLNLPLPLLWVVCKRTALKHAKRVQERGCPRSLRNCVAAGETCCCRKG